MKKNSCILIYVELFLNEITESFLNQVVNNDTEETMVQSSVTTESSQLQSTGNSDSSTTITAYSIWVLS